MDVLRGKVALVTGSSRGIGAAIAELFAAAGARVMLHGRDASALQATRARLEGGGAVISSATGEATDAEDLRRLRDRVEEELGPVDIVVANAGGSPVRPGPVEEISESDWRASIDTNLTATFLTIKTFLPGLKEQGAGSIITMSSAAARRPDARSPVAYTAAKAAIELLTRDVAAQAGPFGVRANCLAPETILTERNQQMIPHELQQQLAQSHPIRRLGTPADVAAAALFLASDAAGWITGTVTDVAGGSVMS